MLEEFKLWLQLDRAPATASAYYQSVLRLLDEYGRVDRDTIIRFIASFENKRSAARHGYAIRKYLRFIGNRDLEELVPIPGYQQTAPKWLTEEQVEGLFRNCQSLKDKCAIGLGYQLALRATELCLLNVDDIRKIGDLSQVRVHRLKGKKGVIEDQELPIDDELSSWIQDYSHSERVGAEPDDYGNPLLITMSGKRLNRGNVGRIFKRVIGGIGVRATFHCLRHSRLTHLASAGMSLTELAELAHHHNINSTLIYTHASVEMLRKRIAELEDKELVPA